MPTKRWWRCRKPADPAGYRSVTQTALPLRPRLTTGRQTWPVTILLALIFTALILLIADLDRLQSGLLTVSQQAMLDLSDKIGAPVLRAARL